MPIYEYRCTGCGSHVEYMQRMSEDPKTTCEKCGGTLERLISAAAFHLKGGGWYKDLYSSTKPSSGSSEGGSKESSSKDSGGGSGDKSGGGSSSGGGE